MALVHVYPHEIGRDLIPELATRVYSSQLDSFREAISNAFDENSKQVTLSIRKDRIVIEDWGNGIKDYDVPQVWPGIEETSIGWRGYWREGTRQAFTFEPWKFRLL